MFFADEINKNNKVDIRDIEDFLNKFNVKYDYPDKTFVIRDKGKIIATGSVESKVLKYFFTLPQYKGEGTMALIYNELTKYIFESGEDSFFVFTNPANIGIFSSLGLKLVYKTEDSALLEGGFYNYDSWVKRVKDQVGPKKGSRGAIVMNCNPMTLGHLYLIEKALEQVDQLLIFLVEEDKSVFPFSYRYKIMEEELKAYKDVKLIGSGPYIISSATFPSYFLKDKADKIEVYTKMDVGIFAEKIARDLEIDKRFLGTEPIDKVTKAYNENIKEILEGYGIKVEIIDRRAIGEDVISASKVRKLLSEGDKAGAYKFLPRPTIDFLESKEGENLIEELRKDR